MSLGMQERRRACRAVRCPIGRRNLLGAGPQFLRRPGDPSCRRSASIAQRVAADRTFAGARKLLGRRRMKLGFPCLLAGLVACATSELPPKGEDAPFDVMEAGKAD